MVHLDVLPRGDVALSQRHVLLDPVRERLELFGRHAAERQLDPHHLPVGLALAVNALLEAELDELLAVEIAAQEAGRLRVEVVELALQDRDDVARDVLDLLWVLERPEACCGFSLRRYGSHGRPSVGGKEDVKLSKPVGLYVFTSVGLGTVRVWGLGTRGFRRPERRYAQGGGSSGCRATPS